MPTKTDTRQGGPSTTTPSRKPAPAPPTLQRLRSGGDAASTLQSSAVAAMGSIRTLTSISSSGTSLHPIAPKRAIKVVLIGDGGCGKTSIRNRFLTNTFFPSYRATIGADFITKTLPLDPLNPDGEKAVLQIWDTAGQERFQSLGSAFYRGADAVVIAFDASKHNNAEEELKRVKGWYEAFMAKAPGPEGEAERRRFCWICAANKSDLLQQKGDGKREKVREVLNSLVKKEEGEVDWGLDSGDEGVRPSGDDEPANPAEVLSRPDPNAGETEQGQSTPSRSASGKLRGSVTPSSRSNLGNGHITSPSKKRSSNYRLSRKSLSSIAAAAAKQAGSSSDADEPHSNGVKGGTMNTLYTTPFNTMSNLPLSASPPSTETTPKAYESKSTTTSTGGTGSGFLSSWMTRSRSKASSSSKANGRGHTKRQSIKCIEVFQISDPELSDASDAGPSGGKNRFAFPSSSSTSTSKVQQETPPRSVRTAATGGGAGGGVGMKDRQRVDSTMSLNAPSVYHTPRSSTFFSVSPTPRTTLGIPSSSNGPRDDGSIKHGHGRNRSTSSSLKVDSIGGEQHSSAKLKYRVSIASSSQLSVATLKPNVKANSRTNSNNPMLRAPKSINDLFQPQPPQSSPPLESPPAPQTPSTISLPIDPIPPPLAIAANSEVETGFTLFYTSAKTGHNIDRMFAHIVHRVVTCQAYTASLEAASETDQQREERETRESENMRRTIRLASGKNADTKGWFGGCC
ncbi:related to YPT7 - GTP-binding protein of the RAB family [Ustilago trichophora]|uniref:Related to YPT7 - GTP-binding protein of the RAB family n=1 Tax=Ustilago trichophora TaxID=86804 RepID=A0A5C3ECE3_9BASI|nr:related to YPT7 - GTP-binding protein of the RAB family [Ustilago trichophora]